MNSHGMFIMRGTFTISSSSCPTITLEDKILFTLTYHGFDTDDHTIAEHRASSPTAIIRNLRILMHFMSDSMTHHFSDY